MKFIRILRPERVRGLGRKAMAWRRCLGKLLRDRRGAIAVEYGFLLALIVIGVMYAIIKLGGANYDIWSNVAAKVQAAG